MLSWVFFNWSRNHSQTPENINMKTFFIIDISEPCRISQVHMLHRTNLVAVIGTGPGAKFSNDKGTCALYICTNIVKAFLSTIHNVELIVQILVFLINLLLPQTSTPLPPPTLSLSPD